jgi:hypothetical protein
MYAKVGEKFRFVKMKLREIVPQTDRFGRSAQSIIAEI